MRCDTHFRPPPLAPRRVLTDRRPRRGPQGHHGHPEEQGLRRRQHRPRARAPRVALVVSRLLACGTAAQRGWYSLARGGEHALGNSALPLTLALFSGTYCAETKTGGSNGAGMRYEKEGGDPANAGLQHARVFLEPIKEKHSWISYADREWRCTRVALATADQPHSLDSRRRRRHRGHERPQDRVAGRAHRLRRRLEPAAARPPARRGAGRRPPAAHLLPHGLQRPGDCGALGRAQPRPLPRRPVRL
jgi:hypothetical protein